MKHKREVLTEDRIRKLIYSVAYKNSRITPGLFEDIVQEAYYAFYKALNKVRGTNKENFNYLYTSAQNGVWNALGKTLDNRQSVPISEMTKGLDEDEYSEFIDHLSGGYEVDYEGDIDMKETIKKIDPIEWHILKRWFIDDFQRREILYFYEGLIGSTEWATFEKIFNKYNLIKK